MSNEDRTRSVRAADGSTPTAVPSVGIDPVLLAAAELFDRLGYEKVRMEDVAARSRISKSTLYRRFPHKTALLSGLADTFAREFALHLAAFTERRHEAAVRWMCADVCGGHKVRRTRRVRSIAAARGVRRLLRAVPFTDPGRVGGARPDLVAVRSQGRGGPSVDS
mgnify:CR=1 FL=1